MVKQRAQSADITCDTLIPAILALEEATESQVYQDRL
jgi:hypothetical protein